MTLAVCNVTSHRSPCHSKKNITYSKLATTRGQVGLDQNGSTRLNPAFGYGNLCPKKTLKTDRLGMKLDNRRRV